MRRRHASFEYLAGNVRMRADRDLAGRRREHSIKYRQGLPLPPTMPPTTFVPTMPLPPTIVTFASGRPSFAADGRPGTAATMHDLRPTRRCRGTKLQTYNQEHIRITTLLSTNWKSAEASGLMACRGRLWTTVNCQPVLCRPVNCQLYTVMKH